MPKPATCFRSVVKFGACSFVATVVWTVFLSHHANQPLVATQPPVPVRDLQHVDSMPSVQVAGKERDTPSNRGNGSRSNNVDMAMLVPDPDPCLKLMERPTELAADVPIDTWQKCQIGESYVFSAFADLRGNQERLLIYSLRTNPSQTNPGSLKCRLWLKGVPEPQVVPVTYRQYPEWKQYRLSCPLQPGERPYAVSVIQEQCEQALNTMYVHYAPDTERKDKYNTTICVPTMYGSYNNVAELVEMIEVNTMFGANKIVLYNYSTGYDVQPYIKSYEREGKVDVIQWDLPKDIAQSPHVHNHGLVSCINDCIHRYMYRTKFVVVADLDEIIVPRLHSSWMEMLEQFLDHAPGHPLIHGSLVFRCVFFRKELLDQSMVNTTVELYNVRTLLNTVREVKVWPAYSRSKYITIPELVDVAGVHMVHTFLSDPNVQLKNHPVEPSHALLHHYRLWEDPPSGPPPVEKDTFMHTYREAIVNRVISRHNVVRNGL